MAPAKTGKEPAAFSTTPFELRQLIYDAYMNVALADSSVINCLPRPVFQGSITFYDGEWRAIRRLLNTCSWMRADVIKHYLPTLHVAVKAYHLRMFISRASAKSLAAIRSMELQEMGREYDTSWRGATYWHRGYRKFFETFPRLKVLGLSWPDDGCFVPLPPLIEAPRWLFWDSRDVEEYHKSNFDSVQFPNPPREVRYILGCAPLHFLLQDRPKLQRLFMARSNLCKHCLSYKRSTEILDQIEQTLAAALTKPRAIALEDAPVWHLWTNTTESSQR